MKPIVWWTRDPLVPTRLVKHIIEPPTPAERIAASLTRTTERVVRYIDHRVDRLERDQGRRGR